MGLGFCKAAIGSFIGWVSNVAKRCKTSAWDEDPVNLQVPKKLHYCKYEPCSRCPYTSDKYYEMKCPAEKNDVEQ